ncbi:MAG: hypothetical protein A2096_14160 [Spirochaetes bacterium GWF1_41_5]|nr:MAG: hypothetical protein A2096_14160 [Spirochaetes bacterium GWF1_41_5]HBE02843.1 sulfur carrier protein ThiS adenylyltransferase ThiF [Spirochaetia bacterium]
MNVFTAAISRFYPDAVYQAIRSKCIGIAGAGGLGSNIAFCLVRSGFEHFIIADSDCVQASNLNRQQFFMEDIGLPKVQALAGHLLRINPAVRIIRHEISLDEKNSSEIFGPCDIIFEAFDRAAAKKMMYETFAGSGKLCIFASGICGLRPGGLEIKNIRDNIYLAGDGKSSLEAGMLPYAPRVTACAALMAGIALEKTAEQ